MLAGSLKRSSWSALVPSQFCLVGTKRRLKEPREEQMSPATRLRGLCPRRVWDPQTPVD